MIKRIFFDFDGVLTTDKTGSTTECKYFSKKLGADFIELFEYVKKLDSDIDSGKITMVDLWKNTCEKFGLKFNLNWLQESYSSTPIDERMLQYATQLKNKYSIGIITDNSTERVDFLDQKHKLSEVFDVIVISEDVKSTKKGTEIFETSAKRAGAEPEECIFIDNKQKNVEMSEIAGMKGVYFDDEVRDYDGLFKEIDEIIENNKI